MKYFDRKKETLRRIVVSQAETIRQLNREKEALAEENRQLKADAGRADALCREYHKLIAGLHTQQDRYAALNRDMEQLKRKLRKVVNHR